MAASRKRAIKLEDIKKSNKGSLVSYNKDFVYSNEICLGDGSFGKVYLGWTKVYSH